MTITKEIVTDLLPLYFANTCSTDSRRLVEAYIAGDPSFAAEVERFRSTPVTLTASLDEVNALRRTRMLINRRTTYFALALFFTLVPFSFMVNNGTVTWLVAQSPVLVGFYLSIAAVFWVLYLLLRRKLNGF